MRTYETQLALNNISVPVLLQEQNRFLKKLNAAKAAYSMVTEAMSAREKQWDEYRKTLATNWECEFPELVKVEGEPYFSFTTLDEAVNVFEANIKKILDFSSLYLLYANLNIKAHSKWLRQVVAEAPENCDLIVIRSNYTPSVDAVRNFNLQVSAHQSTVIEAYGYCPVWIAFRPDEKVRTQNWCMVKSNSTVEYIVAKDWSFVSLHKVPYTLHKRVWDFLFFVLIFTQFGNILICGLKQET